MIYYFALPLRSNRTKKKKKESKEQKTKHATVLLEQKFSLQPTGAIFQCIFRLACNHGKLHCLKDLLLQWLVGSKQLLNTLNLDFRKCGKNDYNRIRQTRILQVIKRSRKL